MNDYRNIREEVPLTDAVLTGKRILITGTTGFVGKVVLEKLMRERPDIGSIVLLIRGNRKHRDARTRFYQEIATSSIFHRLRQHDEAGFVRFCEAKLQFVTGEITEPRLGLGGDEFTALGRALDLIVNCAASVNFREALDQAISINTNSLLDIIELSRLAGRCPVIQVSTCYVHGYHRGRIGESNHPPSGQWIARSRAGHFEVEVVLEDLRRKIERVRLEHTDPQSREQAMIDLGVSESHRYGWNDTYTFTKWMGEQILLKGLQGQSLTIVRPSIVESTLHEPVPGWIEGVKVADAVILAYAREKVTLFPGKPQAVIDIVPVDLVANAIILAAAELFSRAPAQRIYQVSSSTCNPLKLQQVVDYVQEEARENHAQHDRLFYRRPQRRFYMVPRWLFHLTMVTGYLGMKAWARLLVWLGGDASRLLALSNLETTLKLSLVFSFYTAPDYVFSNDNLRALAARTAAETAARYPVLADTFEWRHYLRKIHVPGLNQYALKPRRRGMEAGEATAEQEKTA